MAIVVALDLTDKTYITTVFLTVQQYFMYISEMRMPLEKKKPGNTVHGKGLVCVLHKALVLLLLLVFCDFALGSRKQHLLILDIPKGMHQGLI